MQNFGLPYYGMGGFGINPMNNPHCMVPPWQMKQGKNLDLDLPPLVEKSVEPFDKAELDVGISSDDYNTLELEKDKIFEKLKNVLTANQFETLESWCNVMDNHMSRANKGSYHIGIKIGIKFSKQVESIN